MNLDKGKKTILGLFAVLSLVIITIGGTYAFFSYTQTGTTENSISAGSITFFYDEVDKMGHGIGIEDALPITDVEGKAQTEAFNFRITSKTASNISVPYTITLRQKEGTDNIGNIIKVYLAKTTAYDAAVNTETEVVTSLYSSLSDVTKNGYQEKILYTDTVPVNTANYNQTYRLKMWMDNSTNLSGNEVTTYFCDGTEVALNSEAYTNCDPSDLTSTTTMVYPYEDKEFSVMVNVYAEGLVATTPAAPTIDSCPGCVFAYPTSQWRYTGTPTTLTSSDYNTNYEDLVASTNKNYFIGLKLDNSRTIEKAYACGIKEGTAFCLEGSTDGSTNSANIDLLSTLYNTNFSTNLTGDCYNSSGGGLGCYGSVNANVSSNGSVDVGDCNVNSYGQIFCN